MMIMLSVSNSFSGEVVTKSEKAEIVESINVQDFNPYPVEERIKKSAPYLMLKFKHWCKMLLGAFTAGGGCCYYSFGNRDNSAKIGCGLLIVAGALFFGNGIYNSIKTDVYRWHDIGLSGYYTLLPRFTGLTLFEFIFLAIAPANICV
ncbi:hypothetical protein AGMMS49573_06360 [Endomicrobiia bacterium]|nr:hypothetical protein AGMMS49573_06360 [Endomicrobiia bacterium]